jgi:hypothetical protein
MRGVETLADRVNMRSTHSLLLFGSLENLDMEGWRHQGRALVVMQGNFVQIEVRHVLSESNGSY